MSECMLKGKRERSREEKGGGGETLCVSEGCSSVVQYTEFSVFSGLVRHIHVPSTSDVGIHEDK